MNNVSIKHVSGKGIILFTTRKLKSDWATSGKHELTITSKSSSGYENINKTYFKTKEDLECAIYSIDFILDELRRFTER